ncbi:MAG TPA: response regulator [Solirubrobacterales bacterium]
MPIGKIGNILVVEDDKDWREIYSRNARPLHEGELRTAVTLEEALVAIEEMAFAVAFVDIRLDEADDQNTDGLRVLQALRETRDHTSAIMLTGHGTVAITRDALKEFDAYEAIEKESTSNDPGMIRELIERATEDRNRQAQVLDPPAPEVLRGRRTVMDWDSEMLRVTGGRGGVDAFYRLVENLANRYLPLVPGGPDDLLVHRDGSDLAVGLFWSRAVGCPLMIAFGQADSVRAARASDELEKLAGCPLGETLRDREKAGLAGVVIAVPERSRSTFS